MTANNLDVRGGWTVATARIFSVYGPWEDPRRLVPFVISKLLVGERAELTRGEQIRDYSHVEDAASALWAIAKSSVTGPVNVASSQPVSVASVAERLGALLGRPELLRFGARSTPRGDPAFLVANTDRLRREVGWLSRYDLPSRTRTHRGLVALTEEGPVRRVFCGSRTAHSRLRTPRWACCGGRPSDLTRARSKSTVGCCGSSWVSTISIASDTLRARGARPVLGACALVHR